MNMEWINVKDMLPSYNKYDLVYRPMFWRSM
nr:MAG TPA: Protein of unknown function (DUF551) [Caudoviricetes sp.]